MRRQRVAHPRTEGATMTDSIPTRFLGPERLEVGAIGYGAMSFADFYGQSGYDKDESARAILSTAATLGVTLIDTADVYGPSEEILGRALDGHRDEFVVATKFGIRITTGMNASRQIDNTRAYMRRQVEQSLHRLGTDHIDLYYAHRLNPNTPVEDTVGWMAELVAEGKVRHLGLSEASADALRRASTVHPIAAVQSEWSLWQRGIEDEVLPAARALGIAIIPWSPLGQGALTATITSLDELSETDTRRQLPFFSQASFAANRATVETVRRIAADIEAEPGQVALAWLLHQGDDVVPIPGTRREQYLEQNARAAFVALTPDHIADLNTVRANGPLNER
jgi:aryl-alcohol dehydrogenase-like predicted oxidoreductase